MKPTIQPSAAELSDRYDVAYAAHIAAMSAFVSDPTDENRAAERDAWNAKTEARKAMRAQLGLSRT